MSNDYIKQWRKDNPDKVRAWQRNYYNRSNKVREYRKEYSAKYRLEHKEELRLKAKARYDKNPEPYKHRAWNRIQANRVLKLNGLSESYSKDEIYNKFGGFCIVCDKPIDRSVEFPSKESFTIHHIIPISKGGSNLANNVAPAHFGCNVAVGARIPVAVKPRVLHV